VHFATDLRELALRTVFGLTRGDLRADLDQLLLHLLRVRVLRLCLRDVVSLDLYTVHTPSSDSEFTGSPEGTRL